MGNFLLLGGAGFIGSRLCHRLIESEHRVIVVDSFLSQVHGTASNQSVGYQAELIRADCSETDWITDEISKTAFDCVVILAAETGSTQSAYMAQQYVRTNIETVALLNDLLINSYEDLTQIRMCGKSLKLKPKLTSKVLNARRVLLASSRAVYGEAKLDSYGLPIASQESDPPQPVSVYGMTKLAQELLLATGFPGVETCSLRLQNVYGDGQSLSNPYTGVAAVFASLALSGRDLHIFGNGQSSRDFVYVEDAVNIIYQLMMMDSLTTQVLNVGTGVRTSIVDLARLIIAQSNSDSHINFHEDLFVGDIAHNFADISLLKASGFESQVPLEVGVGRLLDWADTQPTDDAEHRLNLALNSYRNRGLMK